ncbi:hypothetical protein AB6A40_004693 [Gnathostoma spinigerum]|uniref:Uncharacterized protein n=1 Tax=Gnathostoma spinigerum TaxID=75299 RepID=A0ABD6ED83_9BILA
MQDLLFSDLQLKQTGERWNFEYARREELCEETMAKLDAGRGKGHSNVSEIIVRRKLMPCIAIGDLKVKMVLVE